MLPTALIKCSSRLLGRADVTARVRAISASYSPRFLGGGGEQISAEFTKRGWKNEFGPFGRICRTFEQRLVAENVLKMNAAEFEDQLQQDDIFGHMVLPVLENEVGQVTCHVNGDLYPIICYNGYDMIFVFTMESDVEAKQRYYRALWQIHRLHLANRAMPAMMDFDPNDNPEKIEVVGFPTLGVF